MLNFSPGTLQAPPDVKLKSVDLTVSLESLSFFLAHGKRMGRKAGEAGWAGRAGARSADRFCLMSARPARSGWSTSGQSRSPNARLSRAARLPCPGRRRRLIQAGNVKKGDPLQAARVAGILAAKQTAALIPLCHPLPLSTVQVDLTPSPRGLRDRSARPDTSAQTGVEMEALTAVVRCRARPSTTW